MDSVILRAIRPEGFSPPVMRVATERITPGRGCERNVGGTCNPGMHRFPVHFQLQPAFLGFSGGKGGERRRFVSRFHLY